MAIPVARGQSIACPHCGCTQLSIRRSRRSSCRYRLVVTIWQCAGCGTEWTARDILSGGRHDISMARHD
jgi:hypothetical protein